MQVLRRSFEFYVFGNIHVALAAYCLTKISFIQFEISNQSLANFVFFSTILSYNMIRLFQLNEINSMMAIWIKANKRSLIALNSVALIVCVYYLLNFSLVEIKVLLPLLLATVFYVIPFKKKFSGLRNIPGLKLFLIAITWTGLTLYLPLFSADLNTSQQVLISGAQRFLFIIAITIPFDIRDAQFDLPELHTLPQVIGINNSKIIALIALALIVVADFWIPHENTNLLWIDVFIMSLSMLMIVFTGMKQSRFYTAFWIESLPILWYLLYLILVK